MKLYEILGIGGNALGFGSGGSGTSLPALSDSGTVVTSTEPVALPDGTALAPSLRFTNATSSGLSRIGANSFSASAAGGEVSRWVIGGIAAPLFVSDITNQDAFLGRTAAATWRMGNSNSATPVAYTLTIGESSRGGTDTDVAGANGTVRSGNGTGAGTASIFNIATPTVGTTGTTAQTYVNRLAVTAGSVTSTEPIIVPLGLVGNNSIQVVGNAGTGFYFPNTSTPSVAVGGAQIATFGNSSGSNIVLVGGGAASWYSINSDLFLGRRAAANFKLGALDVNGAPVAQTISVQNAITGSNLAGSVFTIDAPLGTGNAAGAGTKVNRALMQATGTTAQTATNALVIAESKTLSNTSATATSLATISVPSNSGGGCSGFITVVASDGTNFDSETQSFNVSYVNKAGTLTIGTPAITASTAASNSGSTTIGITVVAGTNAVDVKVTPVFTTIVPTTVTAYIEIFNHGTGNVTIN